jgi:hypothetical protein
MVKKHKIFIFIIFNIPYRGCFKITFSKNLFIADTQFQNFETSIASILKQALISTIIKAL